MAKMLRVVCFIRLNVPTSSIQVLDRFFRLLKISSISIVMYTADTFFTTRHNKNNSLSPSFIISLWAFNISSQFFIYLQLGAGSMTWSRSLFIISLLLTMGISKIVLPQRWNSQDQMLFICKHFVAIFVLDFSSSRLSTWKIYCSWFY